MPTSLFSVAGYLNQKVFTPNGSTVGILVDIVGDEATGKFTYFIVEGKQDKLYAIHHSYFYQLTSPPSLVLDQGLGNSDYDFFIDLPVIYNETQIYTFTDLLELEAPSLVTAEHRSDDEVPS